MKIQWSGYVYCIDELALYESLAKLYVILLITLKALNIKLNHDIKSFTVQPLLNHIR